MRSVPFPQGAMGRAFAELIRAKRGVHRITLLAIEATVRQRIELYIKQREKLEDIAELKWPDAEAAALKHCYDSDTLVSKAVQDSVFACFAADEVKLCPYCLLRSPEQLDHFLCESKFPEFSVLRINLLWVCGRCNLKKGDRYTSPHRSVLNPYFDKVPLNEPILYCSAELLNDNLVLRFGVPDGIAGVSANFIALAREHCHTFSLPAAYEAEAAALVAGWLRELASRFPQGMSDEDVQMEISHQLARQPQDQPVNHWSSALWFGLAHCAGLSNYVDAFIQAQSPKPIVNRAPRAQQLLNWF